ncbi:porin [Herbaspirillum sp. CAH-3]|nr:porin [Herbaspirillum sp. CAH-3]
MDRFMNTGNKIFLGLPTSLLMAAVTLPCAAQSSVQLTGLLDSGVTYLGNQGGKSNTYVNNGVMRPSTLVLRGNEELGGGTSAIFYLGTMFSLGTGALLGSPGTLFTRESYVGLSNEIGTLSVGMQRDFMFDTLSLNGYSGAFYHGWFGSHQGPFASFGVPYNTQGSIDHDRINGEAVSNAIKFSSKNFSGLSFGALYGFGETAGNMSTSNAVSAGVNYEFGNAGVAAVYSKVKYPGFANGTQGIQNAGLGLKYKFEDLTLASLYTLSNNTLNKARINTLDLTASYRLTAAWNMASTYTYMKGNSVLNGDKANQLAATLSYHFSKSTMIYTSIAHQIASGSKAVARIASAMGPANGTSQTAVTINMQKIF